MKVFFLLTDCVAIRKLLNLIGPLFSHSHIGVKMLLTPSFEYDVSRLKM
jgi:hypothetical protein